MRIPFALNAEGVRSLLQKLNEERSANVLVLNARVQSLRAGAMSNAHTLLTLPAKIAPELTSPPYIGR
jgi:hypothetical protein